MKLAERCQREQMIAEIGISATDSLEALNDRINKLVSYLGLVEVYTEDDWKYLEDASRE